MASPLENQTITAADATARPSLADWVVQRRHLRATFATKNMATGLQLVDRVVAAAEEQNHHPDLDLRFPSLHVSITTHSTGTLTEADVVLAEEISKIAGELGVETRPARPVLEIAVDVSDVAAVKPFWQALLGYRASDVEGEDLADPADQMPAIWFQHMAAPRTDRNRIHLDVHVPAEEAAERVEAALQAGGRLVDDSHAPSWWVVADAEGNEACVCTWQQQRS